MSESGSSILRRAAVALRQHAESLPPPFIGEAWRVVVTDSERPSGIAACPDHTVDPFTACDSCTDIETWHEGTAAFIRLMAPPVALALADLLDLEAKHFDAGREAEQYTGIEPGTLHGLRDEAALEVARVILRERP